MPANPPRRFLSTLALLWAVAIIAWPASSAAAEEEPPALQRLLREGKAALDRGDVERACDTFEEAVASEPSSRWAKLYLKLCEERRREEARPPVTTPEELYQRRAAERDAERATAGHRRRQERAERHLREQQAVERERIERELARQQQIEARQQPKPTQRPTPRRPDVRPTPPPPPPPAPAEPAQPAKPTTPAKLLQPAQPARPDAPASLIPAIEEAIPGEEPVVVHGDEVEFEPGGQKVIGIGHIRIDYRGLRLTADKITVYLETKDAFAEGHVVLTQPEGILTGELVYVNFETKKGTIIDATATYLPLYGKGRLVQRLSDQALQIHQGYLTTCDFDPPHWRIRFKRADIYLRDKVVSRGNVFYVGRVPLLPLPSHTYSLKENRAKVALIPGKHKQWGPFALSAWRYEFHKDSKGTVHLDWRDNYGWAQGVDHRLHTDTLGDHLLRLYYQDSTDRLDPSIKPSRRNRHRLQYRSRWDVDPETLVTVDVEKFSDKDVRRDFLFREEFANETTPETYVSLVRTQPEYTFNVLTRKRVNRFDAISERLPEVKLDVARRQIGPLPFYYDGEVSGGNYTNKRAAPTKSDDDVTRFDWLNELSYPLRLMGFLNFTPRASLRETYFSKDRQGDGNVSEPRLEGERNVLRTVWTTGLDFSTKFYRIFNITTDALGLDLRNLRHVVTPTIAYTFGPVPTVPAGLLQQFDGVDSLDRQNIVTFSLENKLQTKRTRRGRDIRVPALTHEIEDRPSRRLGEPGLRQTESSVDLARFIVSVPYQFIRTGDKGGRFNSITADLELLPYSWMRFETDTTFDTTLDKISTWNVDWVLAPTDRWYAGLGHRYAQNDKTEATFETGIKLSEKWWLGYFGRFTYKEVKPATTGTAKRFDNFRENQVTLSRDLHDWILEVTYRVDREYGEELYFTMRLKAFPDLPFELEESYHQPKIGSQSSPFSPVANQ